MGVSKSGRTCQMWAETSPHDHNHTSFPVNYCRLYLPSTGDLSNQYNLYHTGTQEQEHRTQEQRTQEQRTQDQGQELGATLLTLARDGNTVMFPCAQVLNKLTFLGQV